MGKNLFHILLANIFNLLISILNGIVLPYYLSVDSYALIKTYALYITFAGILHFGYNDGMIIKFGGKTINSIEEKVLGTNFLNFVFLEIFCAFIVLLAGIFCRNFLVIILAFGVLGTNSLGYFKSLYQSTGEFVEYGKALNYDRVISFGFNIFLILIISANNPYIYIMSQTIVTLLVSSYLFYALNKRKSFFLKGYFSINEILTNIKVGYIILCANMSTTLYTAIDRIFVRTLMNNQNFAIYAFTVNLETIVETFLAPIKVAMFNFFCKNRDIETIKKIKNMTLIWGFAVIAAAFPIKWMIENYLVNYKGAISLIFILFSMEPFYTITSGIYANLYKVRGEQGRYFKQMVIMLMVSFGLNVVLFSLFKSVESIAAGTLSTAIIWMIMCEKDLREVRFEMKVYFSSALIICVYLICGNIFNAQIGFIIYFFFTLLILILQMKENLISIINMGCSILKKIINK